MVAISAMLPAIPPVIIMTGRGRLLGEYFLSITSQLNYNKLDKISSILLLKALPKIIFANKSLMEAHKFLNFYWMLIVLQTFFSENAFELSFKWSSQNQQMKSKRNSKHKSQQQQQKTQPRNKVSLLVKGQSTKNWLASIPLDYSQTLTYLDVSNNNIGSLEGIGQYSKLQALNVSNNCINGYEGLSSLPLCLNLKSIHIQNNPVSNKLNFMFVLICMLERVIQVNGIHIDCSVEALAKWQTQNGYKIALFLLQSCLVFDSILKGEVRFDLQALHQELSYVETLFSEREQNMGDDIKTSNYKIYDNLPLKSMDIPQDIQTQLSDIKDYYVEKLLEVTPNQNNCLVAKILEEIEVADEEEQKQLSNRIQFTKLILKNQIQSQFYENQSVNQNLRSNEDKLDTMRHFRSAQTALQTIDTAVRSKKDAFKYGIHFCLDYEYIQVAMAVMNREISRLLKVVHQQTNKDKCLSQATSKDHIKPFEEENGSESLTSPAKIYNNFAILSNLLDLLQIPVKRIAFRKIRKHKNKRQVEQIFNILGNSLSRSILNAWQQTFQEIKGLCLRQSEMWLKMRSFRAKRILAAWRSLRKRKLKLFEKIVKRKIKCDKFLTAIALTKWKMNSRAEKIRKMASVAILGTRLVSVPKSKKGIDLAYRRVMESRRRVG